MLPESSSLGLACIHFLVERCSGATFEQNTRSYIWTKYCKKEVVQTGIWQENIHVLGKTQI